MRFDGGHEVALGHAGDTPNQWAIFDGTDLTADEAAFTEATISALAHRDLSSLAATYPALPSWYMDSLAAYVVPARPMYQLWLPLLKC